MIVLPYLHYTPRVGVPESAHASAALIGRVEVGPGCQFARLATLRADGEGVRVGAGCWFDEASTVHISDDELASVIGSNVTVARYALVHACTIDDDCVIGEAAVVMDGAHIGRGSVLGAASLVPPGKRLEGGWLYAGRPAKAVERIGDTARARLRLAIRTRGEFPPLQDAHAELLWGKEPWMPPRFAPGTGIEALRDSGNCAAIYVAPTACASGRVRLAPRSSIWFGVCLDAGEATISVGDSTNIQDNSWLLAGAAGEDIVLGNGVTVGHNVRFGPSIIEDECLIGMGSIIGPGTVVRAGACVAAGSITEPGTEVPAGQMWSGRPARPWRAISDKDRAAIVDAIEFYVRYASNYREQQKRTPQGA
jgi:carbonic anhydrase/acetyltransferase-like protein (isoleucine patch superfamily)